jgi:serine/threonine protein kinase
VLDFGIAKVRDDPGTNLNDSPTVSMTAPARLMGTAAYMSPEQATGKEADRRSDIWAFGCVLYEMLTGNPAFAGETVSEILAEVLKSEPDFRALPSSTPQSIRRLLRRCLQKDRKRRQRHIGDARLEIEDAENGVQDPYRRCEDIPPGLAFTGSRSLYWSSRHRRGRMARNATEGAANSFRRVCIATVPDSGSCLHRDFAGWDEDRLRCN